MCELSCSHLRQKFCLLSMARNLVWSCNHWEAVSSVIILHELLRLLTIIAKQQVGIVVLNETYGTGVDGCVEVIHLAISQVAFLVNATWEIIMRMIEPIVTWINLAQLSERISVKCVLFTWWVAMRRKSELAYSLYMLNGPITSSFLLSVVLCAIFRVRYS